MVAVQNLITATILTTMQKSRSLHDMICVNRFTTTVVNVRNSLCNNVVHTESTNIFKTRLDTFYSNQELVMINEPKYKEKEAELYRNFFVTNFQY